MFKDKNILVTGGTGSWGQELVRQLLVENKCNKITVMARNEANIVAMSRKYPKVKYLLGDVRDYDALDKMLRDIDIVFHLAAVKHVPICEEQPEEAINTNILGSLNLVKACLENLIYDVILVSTDKAVEPINAYGISKAMAEKIFLSNGFKVIRAGNVIGSSGSVIPLFRDQISKGMPATITSTDMTRFFMTLEQAISLVLKAYKYCKPSEIVILKMPSFYLTDIVEALAGKDWPIEIIGIRPGEKLHEILNSSGELINTFWIEEEGLYIVTKNPESTWVGLIDKISSKYVERDINVLKTLLHRAEYRKF